jgi:hypothetical protein
VAQNPNAQVDYSQDQQWNEWLTTGIQLLLSGTSVAAIKPAKVVAAIQPAKVVNPYADLPAAFPSTATWEHASTTAPYQLGLAQSKPALLRRREERMRRAG